MFQGVQIAIVWVNANVCMIWWLCISAQIIQTLAFVQTIAFWTPILGTMVEDHLNMASVAKGP